MSFNAAMLKQMQSEGLTLDACIRVFEAAERKSDPTNAQRQARHRAKKKAADDNAVTVTPVTPPNDIDILTPHEVSEAKASSPQRAWALPVGVSLQVWQDFLKNRKRKNLPNTDTAWKTFSDDLKRISSQTGIPPPELIQRCAGKGWASINDPRDENGRRPNTLGRNQSPDGLSSTGRAGIAVFGT